MVRWEPDSRGRLEQAALALFGELGFEDTTVAAVQAAGLDRSPLEAVAAGFAAAGALLEGRREFALARSAIIAANPGLQERELIKLASIAAAVGESLRERGVGEPDADLVAELGVAAFRVAFSQWVATADAPPLPELIDEAFGRMAALAR